MADLNPQIIITAKDEASKVLKGVADEADNTGKSLGDALKNNVVALGAAFTAVTGVIVTSIKAFDESQAVAAQLDAVLKSTGGAAGVTRDQVLGLASALQQQSKFGDEAIVSGENLLLTFTSIGKDVFPQATQTMVDMSTALGQDLKSSAIQLGKALNDPIQGVTALRRVGVSFNEEQLKQIETMQKSGNLLGAQTLILKELGKEFGGSALASAKTFGGQMVILMNNVNDLQETIGSGLLGVLSNLFGGFENLNAQIVQLNAFLTEHKDVLAAVSVALIAVAATFGVLFVAALIAVAGTAGVVIAVIGAIIAVVAALGTLIIFHWQEILTFTQTVWGQVVATFQMVADQVGIIVGQIIAWFQGLPQAIEDTIVNAVMNRIPFALGFMIGFIVTTLPPLIANIIAWFQQLPGSVSTTFTNVMNAIVTILTSAWNWITTNVGSWPGKIRGFIASIPSIVGGIFEEAKNMVGQKMQEAFDVVTGWWNKIKDILQGIKDKADAAINAVKNAFNAGNEQGKTAGKAGGGVVPGAIGSPQVVLAHGGETIQPFRPSNTDRQSGGGMSLNVYVGMYAGSEIEKRTIAEELYAALVNISNSQGKSVSEYMGG